MDGGLIAGIIAGVMLGVTGLSALLKWRAWRNAIAAVPRARAAAFEELKTALVVGAVVLGTVLVAMRSK